MDESTTPQETPDVQPPAQQPPEQPAPEPVRKEKSALLVPLLILLVLVSAISGWYLFMNKTDTAMEREPVIMAEPAEDPLFLTITSPAGSTTAVNGEILVAGKTLPGTTVVIFTDTDDTSLESDAVGSFESSVVVGAGGGLVRITAYGETEEITETINVTAQSTP